MSQWPDLQPATEFLAVMLCFKRIPSFYSLWFFVLKVSFNRPFLSWFPSWQSSSTFPLYHSLLDSFFPLHSSPPIKWPVLLISISTAGSFVDSDCVSEPNGLGVFPVNIYDLVTAVSVKQWQFPQKMEREIHDRLSVSLEFLA